MTGSIAHSPADILRHLLVDDSIGVLPSVGGTWPIYVANEPNSPDSVITIYDTVGQNTGRFQDNGEIQTRHGVQIRLRDPNHTDGYIKANEITEHLDKQIDWKNVTISSTTYTIFSVSRTTDVIPLGMETEEQTVISKRNIFTINALITLRDTT